MGSIDSFEKSFRAVVAGDKVSVYHDRAALTVDRALSFDAKKEEFTSLDLLAASILSEVVLTMQSVAKGREMLLQDLEATAHLTIEHPLRLLGVRGYEEPGEIALIRIDVYYFSFETVEEKRLFEEEVLEKTIVVKALDRRVNVVFHPVL